MNAVEIERAITAVRLAVIDKLGWIKRQQLRFAERPRQSVREMVRGETHDVVGQPDRLQLHRQDGPPKLRLRGSDWLDLFVPSDTDGGSCTIAARRIWLNLELAKKPPQCLEYVVVHELAHVLERHHNQRFIALLDAHLPSWRQSREILNHLPLGHGRG